MTSGRDEKIVELLRERGGQFVSGNELAGVLGISRAAVGKRVALLRQGGLLIEAVPNRGYRLLADPESLEPKDLMPLLDTRWLGRVYFHHVELTSTNDEAARLARDGAPHGTVVVAEQQSAGRGRQGRSWFSPRGENLCFSVLLRPDLEAAHAPPITLAAAVGVAEGIRGYVGFPPTVKWPNDLLYGGRKVSGILVESLVEAGRVRQMVVGIGLNVNTKTFPPELASRSTSLQLERGAAIRRPLVLVSVLNSLERRVDRFLSDGPGPVIEAWLGFADWLGQEVEVTMGERQLRGQALGLSPTGALRLRFADGTEESITAGELALL